MITRSPQASTMKPAPQPGKSSGGAAAGVDIAGFPQSLYTRSLGDPDTLFVLLLDSAREACQMVERLEGRGEGHAMAVQLSAMQMASTLLLDPSFSLAVRGPSHENLYRVDLDAGTIHLSTRLYAVVSHRTSFFKIEIAGQIMKGPFVVRNPTQNTTITQISEEELRQPSFFASTLAQECLRAQMEQERFGQVSEAASTEASGEIRLMLWVAGAKIPVALRQKEPGANWDIIDGRMQEWVGALSPEAETSLTQLMNFLHELFIKK